MKESQTPLQKAIQGLKVFEHKGIIEYLQSLLPEEKKFAEDVFKKGRNFGLYSAIDGKPPESFTDFYKQYEDE